MTQYWHSAQQIFDGQDLLSDQAICVEDGIVSEIRPSSDLPSDKKIKHHQGILSTGFFDIQVNGGGGALLNSHPTEAAISTILKAHRTLGTTALLPTVISDHPDVTEAAAEACLASRNAPGMMGIHIEGPHISKAKRGTHNADVLRPMDGRTLDLVARLRSNGLAVLITVAPEATTPEQISKLANIGAIVSIGHSNGTAQEAETCLKAGATCFTHLYNAMSPMEGRAPGMVGAAISSDAYCSIIADGIHVDPTMVMLAYRARPKPDRMIAVSDAMPTVGGPDRFSLYGKELHLSEGRLINDQGALAGAHLTMLDAVRNLVKWGVPMEDVLCMGRSNPAKLMRFWPDMSLLGSASKDVLHLSDTLDLQSVGLKP